MVKSAKDRGVTLAGDIRGHIGRRHWGSHWTETLGVTLAGERGFVLAGDRGGYMGQTQGGSNLQDTEWLTWAGDNRCHC